MTKCKKYIFPLLVFFVFSLLGMLILASLNYNQFNQYLSDYKEFFYRIIQKEVEYIQQEYFTSDELYETFLINDMTLFDKESRILMETNPYIRNIEVIQIYPPFDNMKYLIAAESNKLYVNLKIFDQSHNYMISDRYIKIEYDQTKLLDKLQHIKKMELSSSKKSFYFVYGLRVVPENSMITGSGIIISIIFGLLCSLAYYAIAYQLQFYFYEPRGLEKIIFLFEKTEEYSANHSRNVAEISHYLGKKCGLKGKKLKDLKVAAYLHDIGKISIPVEILNKMSSLTEDEFGEIKKHVLYSAEIIENFEELSHLRNIVLYHHEKIDGSGYPEGLMGDEIPLESRILAVADIFEALVGQRPYRDSLDKSEAIFLMRNMALDYRIFNFLEAHQDDIMELITYRKEKLKKII